MAEVQTHARAVPIDVAPRSRPPDTSEPHTGQTIAFNGKRSPASERGVPRRRSRCGTRVNVDVGADAGAGVCWLGA
jgi:hypothetical protein